MLLNLTVSDLKESATAMDKSREWPQTNSFDEKPENGAEWRKS
jgi:hypothetical protein